MSDGLRARTADAFAELSRDGVLVERRSDQLVMADAIAETIEDGRPLVVVAGTGIGKTLAYLVPSILSGRRVVVSTGTRLLQEQLAKRDLPALATGIGRTLAWTTLKGRQNYLCRQKLREVDDEVDDDLARWATTTENGDRDELVDEPSDADWRRVAATSEECPGRDRCPMGVTCFSERAREIAADCDVVITTHHLYAAGVFASHQILPPHDIVVFDEAHLVEQVVRDALSTRVDPAAMAGLARAADASPLLGAARACHDGLVPLVGQWWPCTPAEAVEPLVTATGELRALASAARARATQSEDPRWDRIAHAAALQLENVQLSITGDSDRGAWVEGDARRPVLRTADADLDNDRVARLWTGRTPIFTSATWPDPGPAALGLSGTSLALSSPFPYREHGLLYCPKHLPDPRSAAWPDAVHAELLALIRAAGGRTLALFTSWQAVRRAVDAVAPHVSAPVLVQGAVGRAELLRRFVAEPTSCAFGTIGLGQGIDVPGAGLTLVTLDRVPFPPMHDPELSLRRAARGAAAFHEIDLPLAATTLAQVAGRLIRSADDRGVLAVFDRRLATAGYRQTLLAPLPNFRRTVDRRDAESMLAGAAGISATSS